ncbi:MAG: alpha/beta hydrolase [Rubrivivax sp. SCN 70-15]|nr:MAG: alpha/beta hydrolase [Rubrivivax sp. SCN 70-15]
MNDGLVEIDWAGRRVAIEHAWVGAASARPTIVFLHEGLGSVSMWRDFPQRVCAAVGCRGLVYSRPGYGRSTPRPAGERWRSDFMHRQAFELLPALLHALGLAEDRILLLGHSDGGSIALLHAARFGVDGAVVMAPHLFVEDLSVRSIEAARVAYETTDLRSRLARHHADPDSAFRGWNDIWLDPAFRTWNIAEELGSITCPLLAIQGLDDEYGTMAQIDAIAERVPGTRLLKLERCGHSPHRDQPDQVIAAVRDFVAALG